MLLDKPEVKLNLEELRKDFNEYDTKKAYATYIAYCEKVEDWKFSDGDYYGHLPYSAERMGFSSPRLIKKKYATLDEARWLGKYCSGFSGNKHIITIYPEQKGIQALQATLYNHNNAFMETCTVGFKKINTPENLEAKLISLGRKLQLDDNNTLYIGVGIRDSFSIFLHTYSSAKKPISGRAIAKDWSSEDEWFYHYDSEGQLAEITSETSSLWRKK